MRRICTTVARTAAIVGILVSLGSAALAQTSDTFTYINRSANTLLDYDPDPRNAAALDYNQNGTKDILIGTAQVAHQQTGQTSLGVPRFTWVSSDFNYALPSDSEGFILADYDNDSYIDCYVPAISGHKLYKNSNGVFADVSASVGSDFSNNDDTIGGAWGDYDMDGDLDLLLLVGNNPGNFDEGSDSQVLLRNDILDPAAEFSDQSAVVGFDDKPRINSAIWADFNGDHDVDLVLIQGCDDVLECPNNNSTYFVNNSAATELVDYSSVLFPDKSLLKGNFTLGTVADVNNDARLDLVYVMDDQIGFLVPEDYDDGIPNWNDGEVKLVDGWHHNGWTPIGTAPQDIGSFDYDLDGRIDILGAAFFKPVLYPNIDNGTDAYAYPTAGNSITFGTIAETRGFVSADFVEDGLTELFFARDDTDPFFYKTSDSVPSTLPVWVGIRLKSEAGTNNYYGIGATVTVTAGSHTQSQVVDGGSGRGFQNDLDLVFGLGDYTGDSVDVVVKWPAGGVSAAEDLSIRDYHTIEDLPAVVNSTVTAELTYHFPEGRIDWEFEWETGPNWDSAYDKVTFNIAGLPYGCTPSTTFLDGSMQDVDVTVIETTSGTWRHTLIWRDTNCMSKCEIPFTVQSGTSTYTSVSEEHGLKIKTCLQVP